MLVARACKGGKRRWIARQFDLQCAVHSGDLRTRQMTLSARLHVSFLREDGGWHVRHPCMSARMRCTPGCGLQPRKGTRRIGFLSTGPLCGLQTTSRRPCTNRGSLCTAQVFPEMLFCLGLAPDHHAGCCAANFPRTPFRCAPAFTSLLSVRGTLLFHALCRLC